MKGKPQRCRPFALCRQRDLAGENGPFRPAESEPHLVFSTPGDPLFLFVHDSRRSRRPLARDGYGSPLLVLAFVTDRRSRGVDTAWSVYVLFNFN